MKLSIVIPVYNEEPMIPVLRERLEGVVQKLPCSYEIIIVNDGSTDHTSQLVKDWIKGNASVILLEFSRNFGHQAAITAGLKESTGDAVVILDADLQDPPELIEDMLKKWKEGFKIVLAERISRRDSIIKRLLFNLFYKAFKLLSDIPAVNSGVFGLIDRVVVNKMLLMNEQNRYLPGMRTWVGYSTTHITYHRAPRTVGEAKQSFKRLFKYGMDAIFSFSYKPLRLSFAFGLIISFSCFIYGIILIGLRLSGVNVVHGFTTMAVAIFFLGGVILISNGIIGEYLGRIYDEVKNRPLYIIAQKSHRSQNQENISTIEYN